MKVAVVGTINKDLILPYENSPIESFGGIFYDIAVLAQILDRDNDSIIPVAYIGADIETAFTALLANMQNVSREGLQPFGERNHKVILEYHSPEEREEKSLFPFPSLKWEEIAAPVKAADMIIVNLISGWDLSLEALKKLAAVSREKIYLDVHYLTMDRDELGRRSPRKPDDFQDWLACAKFIQMNEVEFGLLAAECRSDIHFFQTHCLPDQILLVTKGAAGVTLLYQRDGIVGRKEIPGYKVDRIIDTTGCGDSFGAGFVAAYLKDGDAEKAATFGNLVAAGKLTLRGTNEMDKLAAKMTEIEAGNR